METPHDVMNLQPAISVTNTHVGAVAHGRGYRRNWQTAVNLTRTAPILAL